MPVSHACGHDMHTACLPGAAAEVLVTDQASWAGTLLVVLQPAEQLGAGAQAMVDDGLFERFARPGFRSDDCRFAQGPPTRSPAFAVAGHAAARAAATRGDVTHTPVLQ